MPCHHPISAHVNTCRKKHIDNLSIIPSKLIALHTCIMTYMYDDLCMWVFMYCVIGVGPSCITQITGYYPETSWSTQLLTLWFGNLSSINHFNSKICCNKFIEYVTYGQLGCWLRRCPMLLQYALLDSGLYALFNDSSDMCVSFGKNSFDAVSLLWPIFKVLGCMGTTLFIVFGVILHLQLCALVW